MEEEYELRSVTHKGMHICSELVSKSAAQSDLQKEMKGGHLPPRLVKLFKQIKKIKSYGVQQACTANLLTPLDLQNNLFEIKNYDGVYREMSCIITQHDKSTQIVLLFEFRGHQGTDSIPPDTIKRASRLANDAKRLIRKPEN